MNRIRWLEQPRSQASLLSVPAEGDPWERGCMDEEERKSATRRGERKARKGFFTDYFKIITKQAEGRIPFLQLTNFSELPSLKKINMNK